MRLHAQAKEPFDVISRSDVAQLTMPTLLVNGSNTSALHRCVMDELAVVIPHAHRLLIENAGHGTPAENPGNFNQRVREFLLRVQ